MERQPNGRYVHEAPPFLRLELDRDARLVALDDFNDLLWEAVHPRRCNRWIEPCVRTAAPGHGSVPQRLRDGPGEVRPVSLTARATVLLVLAATALAAATAAALTAPAADSGPWRMTSEACPDGPGSGAFLLVQEQLHAALRGEAACGAFEYSMTYAFPLQPTPSGGYRFESALVRLHLDRDARLAWFEEFNDVLGVWMRFMPAR